MDGWMDGCGAAGAGPAPTCGTSSRSAMEAGRIGIHRLLSPRCGAAHHTGACCCGGPRRRRISDDLDAQDPTPLPSFLVSTGTARGRRTCTCWTRSWRTNLDMSSSSSLPLPCHGQSAKLGHMPRSPAHCHIRWSVVCACHLQQQDDPTHLFRCYYCSAPCIYPAKERRCRSGWLLLRRAVDDPDIRLPATTSCRKFFYWLCRNGVQSSCYHDYPIRRGKSFIGSVKTGFTPHVIMIFPPGEGSAGTMKPMSRPTHLHLDGYSFFAVRMDYSEVNAKQQGSPAPRLLRPMRSSDRFVFGSGLAS